MAPAIPFLLAGAVGLQVKGAIDAKKQAKANARLEEQQTIEEARRMAKQQKRNLAMARAMSAAGGVRGETVSGYLTEMKEEQTAQLEWLKKAGASRASMYRSQGNLALTQGLAGAASTAASAVSAGVKSNWWQAAE